MECCTATKTESLIKKEYKGSTGEEIWNQFYDFALDDIMYELEEKGMNAEDAYMEADYILSSKSPKEIHEMYYNLTLGSTTDKISGSSVDSI